MQRSEPGHVLTMAHRVQPGSTTAEAGKPAEAMEDRIRQYSYRGRPLPIFAALSINLNAFGDLCSATEFCIEKCTIDIRLREILICRVLANTKADAEWRTHAELFARQAGLLPSHLVSLKDEHGAWSGLWTAEEQLVIELGDRIVTGTMSENFMAALTHFFSDGIIVEMLNIGVQYVKISTLERMLGVKWEL